MTANDVIEAYVREVVAQLPRAQRRDVALELQALLNEELQGQAASGPVDAARATALVNAFGHPAQVAARYRAPFTVIDPADGERFVRISVIGLLVIWGLGLLVQIERAQSGNLHWLQVLAQWWGQNVLPSFWWPGVLVVVFGLAAWGRRRWPEARAWVPRDPDRLQGGRAATVLAVLGILAGVAVLVDPRGLLQALWGPAMAPAVLEAFTYAEGFRQRSGPVLWTLLALNAPLLLAALAQGRWTPRLRQLELALNVATVLVLLWILVEGPVFLGATPDVAMRLTMGLTVAGIVLSLALRRQRPPGPLAPHG